MSAETRTGPIAASFLMTRLLILFLTTALLIACAGKQHTADSPASNVAQAETAVTPEEKDVHAPAARRIPDESVYPLLLAEFAIRRKAYDTALKLYLEQAFLLNDTGVAQHTTRLAKFMRNGPQTLRSATLWLALEPDSVEANITAARLLANQGRSLEALPLLAHVARLGEKVDFAMLLQGYGQLAPALRIQLVNSIELLAQEYPTDPSLILTQALLDADAKRYPEAIAKTNALFELEPNHRQALLLEARILLAQGEKSPFKHMNQALIANPDNARLRVEYARLLATTDMEAARQQFEILSANDPNDTGLLLSLALISREIGDNSAAKDYLQKILVLKKREDEAHYHLGRIAEQEGQHTEAITHYMQVSDGSEYLPAIQRLSNILVNSGHFEANRDWFIKQRGVYRERSEQLFSIEADILSGAGAYDASMAILNIALNELPNSTSLRYARSMLAEQQNDLTLMESDLRAILAQDPENATALNALGYTLVNRTDRYADAFELISQALELEPDAPAILDSMGWAHYKLGDHARAIEFLTRAYAVFPDAEVAAHLGEVLWVSGNAQQAIQIWQGALLKAPDSPVLSETLQRLGVKMSDIDTLTTPRSNEAP